MEYIVAGPTIVNDIIEYSGRTIRNVLGGSVYCVSGLLLWSPHIIYISKVGPDFSDFYGDYMRNNGISYEGITYPLVHTHYSTLIYDQDGNYREVSKYPHEDAAAYPASRIRAADIARCCSSNTRGIYLEANEDEVIWSELSVIRAKTDAPILWEIPADSLSNSPRRAKTLDIIQSTDLFSLSVTEGKQLFETQEEDHVIEKLQKLHGPCFLRAGARGSYWVTQHSVDFAPSVTVGPAVDQTGCGNASTAASLFAFAEGYSQKAIPMAANISAAFNILQYGPRMIIRESDRNHAQQLLKNFIDKKGGCAHE